jgi:DNA-directed RNA polymerase I subunit RPA43
MSASVGESSPTAAIASGQKPEKKHKRTKSEHKKKREREDDDAAVVEGIPRRPKKNKSEGANENEQTVQLEQPQIASDEPSKKKKRRHRDHEDDGEIVAPAPTGDEPKKERKKSNKHSKDSEKVTAEPMDVDLAVVTPVEQSDKKRKEKKKPRPQENEPTHDDAPSDPEAQDKKKKRKSKDKLKESSSAAAATTTQEHQSTQESSAELPVDSDFPFFTQTISLYVPFFPVGFDKPLTNVASQHLDPMLNHYSPILRGVLLSYSNLNLSDRPAKASITHPPTDQTPALLHSIDEYAVGFGWLTFDAQLFVPSRGKWMEGVVQLQNEGHIGVVCWNKFNASIEAKRLPQGWTWVDLAKGGAKQSSSPTSNQDDEEQEGQEEEDMLDGEELQVVEQIHTTGYWVNEHGRKVSGKLRFRIKNFDVGLAGDYGYLSIEGTFLDQDAERALSAQEREMERARRAKQNPSGLLRPLSRRVPEFSMTKFGREDEEEDDGQRTVLYKGSRPGTPDD